MACLRLVWKNITTVLLSHHERHQRHKAGKLGTIFIYLILTLKMRDLGPGGLIVLYHNMWFQKIPSFNYGINMYYNTYI